MGTDPWGFDEDRQSLARRWRDRRRLLGAVREAVVLGILLILLLGGSVGLRAGVEALQLPRWATVLLFVAILYGVTALAGLPFSYVGGFRWERESGMSTRSPGSWLRDAGKSAGLGLAFSLAAAEILLWLMAWSPSLWWLFAWLVGIAGYFVIGTLAPILLVPLFYRLRPVADPAVRARLEGLAASARVPVLGAYEMRASEKTRRSNAGVMGFGRTRRIVVTDTLFQEYTAAEVDAVLAHELGHQRFRDPFVAFLENAAGSFVILAAAATVYGMTFPAFGVRSLGDMAGLPLLVLFLSIASMVLGPLELYLSRRRESRADRFALELTRDPEAFASAIVKLHDRNLGVAHPRAWEVWLLHSHPSGRSRVELARAVRSA